MSTPRKKGVFEDERKENTENEAKPFIRKGNQPRKQNPYQITNRAPPPPPAPGVPPGGPDPNDPKYRR